MPSNSRSRDRYGRDGDRERDKPQIQSRRRYREDEYDDRDFDDSPRDKRYRGDGYRRARADSRTYDSYDDYESDRRDDLNTYDRTAEDPRKHRSDTERRRERHRTRASPATSPRKRERDNRERGHRRRRTEDDEASPTPRAHGDRWSRTRGVERDRDLEGEDSEEAARRYRRQKRERERERRAATSKHQSTESSNSTAGLLKADALAKLSEQYEEEDRRQKRQAEKDAKAEKKRRRKRPVVEDQPRALEPFPDHVPRGQSKGRIVSGAYLEEGRSPEMEVRLRGAGRGPPAEKRRERQSDDPDSPLPFWKRKKWWWIGGTIAIILLIIIIVVAVVVSNNKGKDSEDSSTDSGDSSTSNLDGISRDSIPESARGTVLDPWTWYDTTDFNVTYTSETVGGLSIMGLNSSWDDSTQANDNVPPLNKPFPYGSQPIRGVNLGGWLSLEPFISPSMFEGYSNDVIDEYTLTKELGDSAAEKLEQHYATFITEQDFAEIRDAGLDHVRIQFSYWAVDPIDGEPYVPRISWRYLLRAIEYCRKYGLRVNLDPHGIPGSQNGFNHSGRQGSIGWLNGDEGDSNAQRSLDFHDKVSKFFAQDRYKNVVTIYGLANEPYMLSLDIEKVLDWTSKATELVQKNGIAAWVAFHDGFLNLSKWKSMLKNGPADLLLDTHQYTIFNTGQIVLNHTAKVNLVCNDWHSMIGEINTTSAGWGPTICGEWSQADTDCAKNLNNVGRGTRWEGTYDPDDDTVYCPTADDDSAPCSCRSANADPSDYSSDYKTFLQTYAEAQMSAYETGMGWFYWTWHTESAPQWSYKSSWKNGFMPAKAYSPEFKCGDEVPSFGTLAENF
ncbi:putative exo-beta-1,3-glucanase [Aspergillus lucknowensis]|uniref:glucan 1,3-beta-glucosidase n=1 Tax=Aspergillus lucknowensis TaxID=176173 RepID=A0ABR4LSU5_9EURO